MTSRLPVRAAALAAATAVVGVLAAAPALATGPTLSSGNGDVKVVNTETVQVYTSSTGEIQTRRVYEQLALTGHGTVDLSNPVSTDHLRNLDGFGGFTVKDGRQITRTTVDGDKRLRSVSNFDGKLPLDVSVAYKLDGRNVKPGDVVGKNGHLEVTYTVKNVTARPQQLTFDDGKGGSVTKTVPVPIPIVGSLDITAPSTFTHVQSEAANMAGDGKGGTKMSFTMTLFPPIGTDTAVFGYSADITDGVVPRAEISALPVNPLKSPTFKSAAGSYQGGADSGVQLTEGAGLIDSNLLKLRDGAAQLLDGIIALRDGAQQLQAGLAGQAAPGSDKLAAGAGKLDAGLGLINDGSKQLKAGTGKAYDGSQQLKAGTGKLDTGAGQLADGQHALEAGLKTLSTGVQGLPDAVTEQLKTNADYQSALQALQLTVFGIGGLGDSPAPTFGSPTLLGGINGVQYALRAPGTTDCATTRQNCGALDAIDGVIALLGSTGNPTDAAAASSLATVVGGLDARLLGKGLPAGTLGGLDRIRGGLSNPFPDEVTAGVTSTNVEEQHAAAKRMADYCAAHIADAPHKCGVEQVAQALRAGVPLLVDTLTNQISDQLLAGIGTPTPGCNPKKTLRCGAAALSDGVDQLAAGAGQLDAGAGQLSAGLGQLDAGAGKLSGGLGQAKDGSGQLAAGAQKLAVGLGQAADGSGLLADGLGKAADGAPKLVDGAQQLSDKGTKKLVAAGQDTAQTYGESYAVFKAGAERASTEDMAFGAPKGAMGLTAYSYVIEGEDGEAAHNWGRGIAGLGVLGAGAGAFALRRRLA